MSDLEQRQEGPRPRRGDAVVDAEIGCPLSGWVREENGEQNFHGGVISEGRVAMRDEKLKPRAVDQVRRRNKKEQSRLN